MYSHWKVAKAAQLLPPDPAMLAVLALHEQQQVCLQRVRYELAACGS
jgi:hypothetical protein